MIEALENGGPKRPDLLARMHQIGHHYGLHAGSVGCLNAGMAVLDGKAMQRIDTEAARSGEVRFGMRPWGGAHRLA